MTTHETPQSTEELTVSACWELLRTAAVGRLAVCVEGRPDIFPVNPVVDHGSVVFRTRAGTKLAAAVGHDVAFEADGYDADRATAWSVIVKGPARAIRERQEANRASKLPLVPWHEGAKPHFVRIEPTSVTGRRFTVTAGVGPNRMG